MSAEWPSSYVGLPYLRLGRGRGGIDCWGLVRMVLGECKGIDLPLYDSVDPDKAIETAGTIAIEQTGEAWLPVAALAAREFDFAIMRAPVRVNGSLISAECHIGIVAPGKTILHVQEGGTSVIQPIAVLYRRIVAFKRHRGLA